VVSSRYDLIACLPKGGRFAEIGTLYGDFAASVTEIVQPEELHLFDLRFDRMTEENKSRLPADTHYHIGCSWEELAKIEDHYFDITYVDGDHAYGSVWKDLQQAFRATKPGGYVVCNDYTLWSFNQATPYGVFSAVNKFAAEKGMQFVYLALQANGYYDVALRRS